MGTVLTKRIMQEVGHSVRLIDNLTTGTRDDLAAITAYHELTPDELTKSPSGVELVIGDILDEQLALKVSHGCDIIIHFAANTGVGPSVQNPRADMLVNVVGVFNYLEAARINKIPQFIFASSGAPAGEVDPPIHEELPLHPASPYGASKLAGEGYCSAYKQTFGINTVALRFGNVYGPGSIHKFSVVAKFIRRALEGETLKIYGDGTQTRDFIYIEDVIEAIICAANATDIGGEVFQIASNLETTIGEMVERLLSILKEYGVHNIRAVNGETRLGDVRRNFSDISKARSCLGWKPRFDLDDGLRRTVAYFLNE